MVWSWFVEAFSLDMVLTGLENEYSNVEKCLRRIGDARAHGKTVTVTDT